jgi:hypothetical protein
MGSMVNVMPGSSMVVAFGSSWWGSAGRSRGKQAGEERSILAHRFVADDGHFTVAGCGDEGDDAAALEESEDALARATYDGLDLLLRGRGVKHLSLSVSVRGVDAIKEDGVKMWI